MKILIFLVVAILRVAELNVIPLEAAFQGLCENGNPCAQNCYNIHNEMYECDCNPGYVLSDNGYSCIAQNETLEVPGKNETRQSINIHLENPSSTTSPNSPINIHIEVDIDPPRDTTDQLSPDELQRLGLPATHVHYSNVNKQLLNDRHAVHTEELLAPSDIKVTYSEVEAERPLRDKLLASLNAAEAEVSAYDNFESFNKALYGSAEPPRALPVKEQTIHKNGDLSDRIPPSPELTFEEKLFSPEAMCNLDCGEFGTCLLEKMDKDSMKKRCLCPMGKSGEKCAFDHTLDSGSVHFSGHSWISLPTLTHAYSDLQLSFEFKPEQPDGILLLTGETGDMTGDYLALLLRDGHVELRLDCGTGPGIVKTTSKVHLQRWNRLTAFRHDWGVWLQLNGGKHEEGRSQGLFSRITFAQPVVLGGTAMFLNAEHFLETDKSYQGCMRNLEINNKAYSLLSRGASADVLNGMDIEECHVDDDDCQTLTCQHHGVCTIEFEANGDAKKSSAFCQCPLGFDGQFCETPVEIRIPSFNGKSSHLVFPGLGQKSPLWNDFELVIRPTSENGLILYNGDHNNPNGDFVAVFLSGGFIEFAFDAGDGVTLVRSATPLKLNSWHTIRISRTGLLAEVQVNDKKRVAQLAAGAFTQVVLRQSLYLGGVPTFEIVSPFIPVRTPFAGCIQKVMINNQHVDLVHGTQGGINVSPCWSHPCSVQNATNSSPCGLLGTCRPIMNDYSCECPLGLTGARCEHSLTSNSLFATETSNVVTTRSSLLDNAPAFTGDSFLHYNDEPIAQNIIGNTNTFNLRVKIESGNGLLLWTGGDEMSPASDFLLLGLQNGFLHFRFNLGNGEGGVVYNSSKIDDGKWHRIRATRIEQTATLRVDNGPIVTGASPGKLRQLNGNGQLFIGGVGDLEQLPVPQFRHGFVGCVSELSVGKLFALDLLQRAQNGQNVDSCRETFDF